jgi:hypothetical protein
MIRNKRGNLIMDSVPGIIIAVLCLLILGGVVVLVWKALVNDEYSRAQTAIDFIENKMNALKNAGESTTFSIQSPCNKADECDWFIYAWGKDNTMADWRPEKCYFNSCICVCRGKTVKKEEIVNSCQDLKTGICRVVEEGIVIASSSLNVNDVSAGIPNNQEYIANCNGIKLKEPMISLSLIKGKNSFDLKYSSDTQKRSSTECPDFVSRYGDVSA